MVSTRVALIYYELKRLILRGRRSDIAHVMLYPGRQNNRGSALGSFPIDFREVALRHSTRMFDADGIPVNDYGPNIGIVRYPINIAQHALGSWELWQDGHEQFRTRFMLLAEWFVQTAKWEGAIARWLFPFDYPQFGLRAGWTSAMAQGEISSVLLRAYQETREEKYLVGAVAAIEPFFIPVVEGGLVHSKPNISIIFEEYPSTPPSSVLNGWIFALFGLAELVRVTASARHEALLKEALDALFNALPEYDLGWWTLYDHFGRNPNLTSGFYHRLHVIQLKGLARLTGQERFDLVAEKWARYASSPSNQIRALTLKVGQKIQRRLTERLGGSRS